ncbi:hypothetical protein [Dechloromonas sp. A34]|uniref:hypothetical protein n=1 Tax=Dechloromonas sp. A34 TaxID=447588 RepID=UPI002248A758|nr:hypothetical protein [Dechloromonas sp. A34]
MKPRHLFLLSLLMIGQNTAWAEQEALGRLFFTPQQRAELNRQRLLNPGVNAGTMDQQGSQTINGEVRRSSGRNTRWINGEVQGTETTPAPRIPVGDTFHPGTGEHQSVLGSGRIVVKPARTP